MATKSVRIQSSCQYLFTLLGSTGAKAAHRTLMKLTPGVDGFQFGGNLRDLSCVSHSEESFQKSSESASVVLTFSTFAVTSKIVYYFTNQGSRNGQNFLRKSHKIL